MDPDLDPELDFGPDARLRIRPAADVFETADSLVVVVDVPGADPRSIEILLIEDVLTLRARASVDSPEASRAAGEELELPVYERAFHVAAEIDPEAPEATFRNGRVKIVLRKRQPRAGRFESRAS